MSSSKTLCALLYLTFLTPSRATDLNKCEVKKSDEEAIFKRMWNAVPEPLGCCLWGRPVFMVLTQDKAERCRLRSLPQIISRPIMKRLQLKIVTLRKALFKQTGMA